MVTVPDSDWKKLEGGAQFSRRSQQTSYGLQGLSRCFSQANLQIKTQVSFPLYNLDERAAFEAVSLPSGFCFVLFC